MLRSIFVLVLLSVGTFYALRTPFYSLLFYLGYAYFRPEQWLWNNFVSGLRLSFLIGVYVVAVVAISKSRFVWNGRIAAIALFTIVAILSTVYSLNSAYSWVYCKDFLKAVVIGYVIIVLVDDMRKFRLVVLIMVLAGGLEQAKQGWVHSIQGGVDNNIVPFFGDNNGVAVGMLMLSPLIGFLLLTETKEYLRVVFASLLGGAVLRALFTYSRGGFLALLGVGAVWFMRSSRKFVGAVLLVGVGLVSVIVLPDSFWERMTTITRYREEGDTSALGRLHFWRVAIDMANSRPVLGVGFNGYNPAYDRYDSSGGKYGEGRSAHSSFFGVLAELGYLGLVLYLLVLFGAFRCCWRVLEWSRRDVKLRDYWLGARALEASLVVFLIGGSFIPFQYNEMLWHLVALSIVLERITPREERSCGDVVAAAA